MTRSFSISFGGRKSPKDTGLKEIQKLASSGNITTIGRGGSDATAVAVAKLFDADACEIYTDVDGVFSTDPNKIPVAKKIDKISYDEMLELSSLGAKVMQPSAVQTALMYDIPLEVRSTFVPLLQFLASLILVVK